VDLERSLEVEHRREGIGLLDRAELEQERRKDQQGRGQVLSELEDPIHPRRDSQLQPGPMQQLLERAHGTEPAAEVATEERAQPEEGHGAHEMPCPAPNRPVRPEEHEDLLDGLDGARRRPLQEAEEDQRPDDHHDPDPAAPGVEEQRRGREERPDVHEEGEAAAPVGGPEAERGAGEEGD